MKNSANDGRVLIGLIAIAVVVRMFAVLIWGPLYQGDSHNFIGVSRQLVENSLWFTDADLEKQVRTGSAFRMLGYASLIVLTKFLLNGYFEFAIIVLQSAISVATTALAFKLARALGLGIGASVFNALAYSTSLLLFFDMNILVDSFFANGLFAATAILALGALCGGQALRNFCGPALFSQ